MTDFEICRSYRNAINPSKQISILAQLNNCKPSAIREVLQRHGEATKLSKKHLVKDNENELMKLYSDGISDLKIARASGFDVWTIRKWRSQRNLTSNSRKGGVTY
jgi:hypothetical protein